MSWGERLYGAAPASLQNIGLTLHGWRVKRHRYGHRLDAQLADLVEQETWAPDRLRALQAQRLRRVIRHAFERSPFYRSCFEERGLTPKDIQTVEDLRKLPILTKDQVRARGSALMTGRPRRGWLHGHTSGTTGSPLSLWYDRMTCVMTNAVDARHKRWAGMSQEDWLGIFLGRVIVPMTRARPPYWRVNRSLRQVWFSSFHLSDANLPSMIAEVERRGLRFLEGYPSTLFVVASFLLRAGRTLPMQSVISSSETLHSVQRDTIESAFKCPLFDFYAMAERVLYAGECECHDGKHLAEEYGVLEVVDDAAEPVTWGTPGHVVGTSLHNLAMPMIRYRVGDITAGIPGACACGRTLPRIRDISTKAEDIVVTPDGRWISPSVLTHPFKPLDQIRESQILQDAPDHLTIKVVPTREFSSADEARLRASLQDRLGSDMRIDIQTVTSIPREPSGKFRWVISQVPHDLLVTWG